MVRLTALALAALLLWGAAPGRAERLSALDNGRVKIGIDLDRGGVITFLADDRRGQNLINSFDLGRQIQQSYYAGPTPFGHANPAWKNWPWNPIGTGDSYGHPAKVLATKNDGRTLYVKSIPMQWALNNVPGDCTFETWITLNGNTVHVRNRLTNLRTDQTQYPAMTQELPAVYTVGTLGHLFTYDGPAPYTGGPLREITARLEGGDWGHWDATEHWAALVGDDRWGLGVFHPTAVSFSGGFAGPRNVGGPQDASCGYIAPNASEILDYNIVYEYEYTLILGTLDQIRAYAVSHRPADERPNYHFTRDRQHWHYINATDTGLPIRRALHVLLVHDDPQLIGPRQCWQADDVPKLFLRAAFHTRPGKADLFWAIPGGSFSEERKVSFDIIPDGKFHTYAINLSSAPAYKGLIAGLRLDPVPAGAPGEYVEVTSLSWRR